MSKAGRTIMFKAGDVRILWAALQAMVNDCHAPQDDLTLAEWDRAADLLRAFDDVVNDVEEP